MKLSNEKEEIALVKAAVVELKEGIFWKIKESTKSMVLKLRVFLHCTWSIFAHLKAE